MVYDLGGLGLRLAPVNDVKCKTSTTENNKSLQSQATAQSLSQLMDFIRRSGDSADERNPQRSSSKIPTSNAVLSVKIKEKTNSNAKSKIPEAPNLIEMLHKAEVDFNSKSSPDSGHTPEPNINTELQRLRSVCNITSPTAKGHNIVHTLSNGSASQPVQSNPPQRSGHHSVSRDWNNIVLYCCKEHPYNGIVIILRVIC
ncbi:hypothetical protein FGIG_09291 [Fasciola gigantica]|uniref:Uncharacterized protein n=1 Tax=Fasciola gigantica TaxID=46835 RepID=A0A504YHT6_FASGI|nr:hypothetical protein FGIG_09291 [Fasciola gigantica]